jgi:hypothetical protein
MGSHLGRTPRPTVSSPPPCGWQPHQLRARARILAEADVRRLQKEPPRTATVDQVPCRVGGTRTTCQRVQVRLAGHEVLALLRGGGRIFAGLVSVACFPALEATGQRHDCAPYLTLPGARGDVGTRPPHAPGKGR